jgi:type VI secretion system protein ImpB
VHLKYKVHTGGATVEKELPFVIGVLGDYSGNNPQKPRGELRDRSLIELQKHNFNEVLAGIGPGLNMSVPDRLSPRKEGEPEKEMQVQLKFNSMKDFEPAQVARQIPATRKLLEMHDRLLELKTKADLSQPLEKVLAEVLRDPALLERLKAELGLDKPVASASDTPAKEG